MTFTTPAALLTLAPTGPSLVERLGALRAALAKRAAQARASRAVRAELEAMSNRDLADIGLARSDIARVAVGAARA